MTDLKAVADVIEDALSNYLTEVDGIGFWNVGGAANVVAAVVEAHLRPVVTTVAELEALPHGSVIRSEQGGIWQKLDDVGGGWYETGSGSWHPSTNISLDATVIYRPAD